MSIADLTLGEDSYGGKGLPTTYVHTACILFLQDVLVNVTDLSHPQFYAQRANVQHVLEQLRLTQGQLNAVVTVLNKADKVYVHDSCNSR